jgi:hypothetical protein
MFHWLIQLVKIVTTVFLVYFFAVQMEWINPCNMPGKFLC